MDGVFARLALESGWIWDCIII